MIAGAILYSNNNETANVEVADSPPSVIAEQPSNEVSASVRISEVTAEDHILGDPDALVKMIEFSDLECPFCKRVHTTLQQIIDEYGDSGQVAWVYRHFPLDALHPIKARTEAVASECANELGGNDKFWEYIDRIFEITPSNNQLDLDLLPVIAEDIGLDRNEFEECLNSGRYDQHIQDDLDDAKFSGGQGTPYTVIVAPNGTTFPVSGAQPYSVFKSIVDLALEEI